MAVTVDAGVLILGTLLLLVVAVGGGVWAWLANGDADRLQTRLGTLSEAYRLVIQARDEAHALAARAEGLSDHRVEMERRRARRLEEQLVASGRDLVAARALLDGMLGRPLSDADAETFRRIAAEFEAGGERGGAT